MKAEQDAYGREVYDYFRGRTEAVEIVEREDGLITLSAGPAAYFETYEEWPSLAKEAMRYVHGRVLDIGCGAGRHSLYLQEQGLEVMGIDNSPLAIEVSRQRGLKKARLLSITQVSSRLGTFDTILMMGNNFGLMANARRARWLLKRFYGMTSADGRIVANSLNPYQTNDPDHLAYQEWNRRRGRMAGQIRIRIRYRKYKGVWFDYLLVSPEEMRQLLQGTGWYISHVLDSNSPVYIAIIEKS